MNKEDKVLLERFLAGEELSQFAFSIIADFENLPAEAILKLVNQDEWDYYPDESEGEVADFEQLILERCLHQENLNTKIIEVMCVGTGITENLEGEEIELTDRFTYFYGITRGIIETKLVPDSKIEKLVRNLFEIELFTDYGHGIFTPQDLIELLMSIESNYVVSKELMEEIALKKAEVARIPL